MRWSVTLFIFENFSKRVKKERNDVFLLDFMSKGKSTRGAPGWLSELDVSLLITAQVLNSEL